LLGQRARAPLGHQKAVGADGRSWPVRDLRLVGTGPGFRSLVYPYVAPHTAKIHTPITLGIRRRTKPLVFELRRRCPRGFDSHRPLHSSLSGRSLRCPRTRLGLSRSCHSLDATTTNLLIGCDDRSTCRVPFAVPSIMAPEAIRAVIKLLECTKSTIVILVAF
jgi:hypothetical protein